MKCLENRLKHSTQTRRFSDVGAKKSRLSAGITLTRGRTVKNVEYEVELAIIYNSIT